MSPSFQSLTTNMSQPHSLHEAYRFCLHKARSHYENFPVASWFLPRRLRLPIAVIYAFARSADDLADEGDLDQAQRLHRLDDYRDRLNHPNTQQSDPIFLALNDVVKKHDLPIQLLYDLLTAFRMDVTKKRYKDFTELQDYCRHSANPIGRLLLHLNQTSSDEALYYSDRICTALQLINFCQDLAQDYTEHQRIYIPQDEMQHYGVTEQHFRTQRADSAMQQLMAFQVQRAGEMLLSGSELGKMLPGRLGLEIRMVTAGGRLVCQKLMQHDNNPFARPRLNKTDWLRLTLHALLLPSRQLKLAS